MRKYDQASLLQYQMFSNLNFKNSVWFCLREVKKALIQARSENELWKCSQDQEQQPR